LSLVLIGQSSSARVIRDFRYPSDRRGWSWLPSLYFELGLDSKVGSIKSNDENNIPKANLLGAGASSHIGWSPSFFNLGMGVEYFQWSQITDVATIGNLNLGGTQYSIFINGGVHFGSYSILAKYYVHSVYTFENNSRNGNQLTLEGIDASFGLDVLYHVSHFVYMGVSYASTTYQSYKEATISNDLTQQQTTSLSSLGFKVGLIF
jgi:hypothetical protein